MGARQRGGLRRAVVPIATAGLVLAGCGSHRESSLRAIGESARIRVGTAVQAVLIHQDGRYEATLGREYDLLTPENDMKWTTIHPSPGAYDWGPADSLVRFAKTHGMQVHGHNLVWTLNPPWVNYVPSGQLARVLRDHIRRVVGRYRGRVAEWDVVNEGIGDNEQLKDNVWLRGIGPGYIEKAFRWAHQADPHARLFYNDYGAEGLGPKSDAVLAMLRSLKRRGVPIDGVGLEMHLVDGRVPEGLAKNMRRLAALRLEIAITEMDVRLRLPATRAALRAQAATYRAVARICARQPSCKEITTWGFTDRSSWIPGMYPGYGAALPFDPSYRRKPAYFALRGALDGSG